MFLKDDFLPRKDTEEKTFLAQGTPSHDFTLAEPVEAWLSILLY